MNSENQIVFETLSIDDLELPKILYKYRSWKDKFHKRILTNQEIHFDSPFNSAGNNRDELVYKFDFNSVSKEDIYYWFYQDSVGILNEKDRIEFAKSQTNTFSFEDSTFRQKWNKIMKQSLNQEASIFCASEKNDNISLWENFGNNHEGFCVGFDAKELFKNTLFPFSAKVEYCKDGEEPLISPFVPHDIFECIEHYRKRIMFLPAKFKGENEYRFVKLSMQTKTFPIPKNVIKEITFGYNMCDEYKNQIRKVVSAQKLDVEFFQVNFYEIFNCMSVTRTT